MIRKLPRPAVEQKNDYPRPQDAWVEQPLTSASGDGRVTRRTRSLRFKRMMFTLACTAFTVGALILIGSSPYKNDFLAPGPLCSSHAQILSGQGADRCAACHGAADQTLAGWVMDAFSGGRRIAESQSDLCLKCHEKSFSREHALNPHNVAADQLQRLTSKLRQASFVSTGPSLGSLSAPPVSSHNEIACSACHREHHGVGNLSALTDQQCQACHANTYHSFETDHPEFTNWPQQRRSRIAFDHSTHAGKHFPGKQTEFDCSQCHVDDAYGNVKLLASFEQSCAACHDQQIQQSGESGFAIFALPSIDTDAVEQQGLKIGTWPLAATGDFDGQIPPAMRLLLHADPVAREALQRFEQAFGASFGFADIDDENADQVADAVTLVWAMKRLLNDLSVAGRSALAARLTETLGTEVDAGQVARLASELDEPVFQATVQRWLPGLAKEVAEFQLGKLDTKNRFVPESSAATGSGQRFVPVKFSRPVQTDDGELAPNPLPDLFETPSVDQGSDSAAFSMNVRTPKAGQSEEPAAVELNQPAQPRPLALKNALADQLVTDDQLLAVNPLSSLALGGEPRAVPPVKTADESEVGNEQSAGVADWVQPPTVNRHGWYRDDELFRVFYRPGGHEDACLAAWSDLIATVRNANARPETQPLFKQLLSDKGVGLCATCHTVDQLADESFAVNWQPTYRDPSVGQFTKFSHQPHTLQPHLQDCAGCHDMANPIGNQDSFVGFDPSVVVSNFAAITKMNCVSCHRAGQTNNSCTHCHSYHVGAGQGSNKVDAGGN